ncbi:HAD-superfamily hydrolase, subfamily IA, variant 3 [Chthoniobacter flavus Ellin428]|uniref:HAD-superfamily hydrolase, subfamily IA, variant 3 n=1 Tax=Chthoniobacter flavus Ellin428 TaxID=497964 RepID=B4DAT3_9BACT|nr:HAD-IA family hydrolase [Chthoniobacter flavus]EDY16405.1 HAD-superfamily hydrolase, subfamily IA, variant 3 [Chthoniobacter flavus Ellin428]TCO81802.1 HAD superfamily hydrolase (TIGR01509 family) [Chthoniobacter flavus]
MTSPPSLVIFDNDGVLVDSEELSTQMLVDAAREYGPLAMELSEAMRLFRGRKMAECVAVLSERLGHPLPEDFTPNFRARQAEAFRHRLKPIPGIHEVLWEIRMPVCVASNGPREKIALALSVTGLLPFFEGRIFSSYELGTWKPDPGLYLHAAAEMGVAPADCVVVEDSVLGVRAGIAAGMRVLAYIAAGDAEEFHVPGVTRFERMSELPALLR